jgi:hypothetical protein
MGQQTLAPGILVWASLLIMIALVLSSFFGIFVTAGRSIPGIPEHENLSLHVFPDPAAIEGTITLYGSHFTPNARIGLTRDNAIPIVNTTGSVITQADANGRFTNTVIIPLDWTPGPHVIHAEDSVKHTIASFPISITGQGGTLRPAHLKLSQSFLDLGAGNPSLNSSRTLSLTNAGDGQISWQGSTNQPWLLITPKSGTFVKGQSAQVTIAVDRSQLRPGPYRAFVIFSSGADESMLDVRMQVTTLHTVQEAVLQLSPAVLSFTATAGGDNPTSQVITVSNPGKQSLQWHASADANWLSLSSRSGTITADSHTTILITVQTSTLLPGYYNGLITFSSNADGVEKSVSVSISIAPPCSLQVSPATLTFAGVSTHSLPPAQVVNLEASQACQSAISWIAKSDTNWLTLNTQGDKTPSRLSVSLNTIGLIPGIYHGSIIISSAVGTQTISVTFTMGQAATPTVQPSCTLEAPSTQVLDFTGNSAPQTFTVSVGGACPGNVTITPSLKLEAGKEWLTVTPQSVTIAAGQRSTFTIAVKSSALPPGDYRETITLVALNSGVAIAGSAQKVGISLSIPTKAPALTVNPSSINFNITTGTESQVLSIANTGGSPLNWTAALNQEAPAFISLSASSGRGLAGGRSTTLNVIVNAMGVEGNRTYHAALTVSASDPVSGKTTSGSPVTIPITVHVAPPAMEIDQSTLHFSAHPGDRASPQTIVITNTGGNTLTWQIGSASRSWLSVKSSSNRAHSGASTKLTFSVESIQEAGQYFAFVVVTPSVGPSRTIHVTFTVEESAPATIPSPTPTQLPSPSP